SVYPSSPSKYRHSGRDNLTSNAAAGPGIALTRTAARPAMTHGNIELRSNAIVWRNAPRDTDKPNGNKPPEEESDPMARMTEHRRRINRQNAQKSTGPKTNAGKSISSLNATTHGLAGRTEAALGADAPLLGRRLAEWTEYYKPSSPAEQADVARAGLASV